MLLSHLIEPFQSELIMIFLNCHSNVSFYPIRYLCVSLKNEIIKSTLLHTQTQSNEKPIYSYWLKNTKWFQSSDRT